MRKKRLLAILCLPLLFCAGCFDYRDIENRTIPIVAAYDLPAEPEDTENGDIVVSGVVLNPTTGMDETRIDSMVVQTTADARNVNAHFSPGAMILGQLQVILHSEDIARRGLEIDDGLLRVAQIKRTMYMAIVEGRADDLLKTKVTVAPDIGFYLLELLNGAQRRTFLPATTMHNFEVNATTTGKNPIIPIIKAEGGRIHIVGTGIFNKEKLIAKVGIRDTRSLVLLRGLKCNGFIPFVIEKDGEPVDKGTVAAANSRKVRVEEKDGRITFLITVFLKGNLLEHSSSEPVDETRLQEIQDAVSHTIASDCNRLIRKMQEDIGVDFIDITKYARAKWGNDIRDQIKEDDFIKHVRIVVKVRTSITHLGQTR